MIDDVYFKELAERDPDEVCRRVSCRYNPLEKSYGLQAWGHNYAIFPGKGGIVCQDPYGYRPHPFFCLFIVFYLLRSKEAAPHNVWISEKELPGGATFFRGPHEIPTRMISDRFGNDIEAFNEKCTALQGVPLEMAEAAYRFDIVPNIPAAVLYWTGDDEFQPEAKIIYDSSISTHMTSDIVFALAVEICSRVSAAG